MAKGENLWIAFSKDELELPLAVADTYKELAEFLGVTNNFVLKLAKNKRNGKRFGVKKINIDLNWRKKYEL